MKDTTEANEFDQPKDCPSGSSSLFSGFMGLAIEVDPMLKGQKRMIRNANTIYVSPAFWSLMKNADEKELEHLMRSAEVIDLTSMFVGFNRPLPPQFS